MKNYIFFDLDGTLTDSMPGIVKSVQHALKHYGIEVEDLNELKPFVGPPLVESFQKYYGFTKEQSLEAITVFREYYTEKGWCDNAPYDGIEFVLQNLIAGGKKLYVATSKPEWMAKKVLEYFCLDFYFEFIGGAESDETRSKKDEVIRYVMESCGLQNADEIVMVGDRSHDIVGAHKAGLEAVGILYGYGDREEMEQANAEWITETTMSLGELLMKL